MGGRTRNPAKDSKNNDTGTRSNRPTPRALSLSRHRGKIKKLRAHVTRYPSRAHNRPLQSSLHAARTSHHPPTHRHSTHFSVLTHAVTRRSWLGKNSERADPLALAEPQRPAHPRAPPLPRPRFYCDSTHPSSLAALAFQPPSFRAQTPHTQPPSALAKQCQGSNQAVPRKYPGCREGALTWRRWHLRVGDPPRGRRGARPGHGQGWE